MDKIKDSPPPLVRKLFLTACAVPLCLLIGIGMLIFAGDRYRFYFRHTPRLTLGSEYFDAALSSDCFLGYESLGEYVSSPEQ